jgi:esterase/lipase superfamily enzyme
MRGLPVSAAVRAASLVLLVALAGCAGNQARSILEAASVTVEPGTIAGTHDIHVATTRAKADDPTQYFDGRRGENAAFVTVEVSVPRVHRTGAMERPGRREKTDPAKHFSGVSVTGHKDVAAFEDVLRRDIAARGGRALVFIHGYNTKFDEAVYRVTQIVHDANYAGAPVLFTWASAGRTLDYVYDQNSATAARDALEQTLRAVADAGATRIDIIAHSMGNWVTLEALRQLAISGDRDIDGRLGDVVLASPDVDVDVFKSQMRRYGKPDKPFFVLLSRDDRALELSSLIAGNRPRLGGYADEAEIASYGVIVANLSGLEAGDPLNHTKFADNPLLVRLLGERLAEDDLLQSSERDVTDRVQTLARGLGQTITSAAEIVITTPVEVVRIAVGQ